VPVPVDVLLTRPGLDANVRAIACAKVAVWRGDWDRLAQVVRAARALGCARQALEEGLLQGVLFYGFPRTITAFETLSAQWPAPAPTGGGLPPAAQPAAGQALFRAIYGRNADAVGAMLHGFHRELHDFVLEVAYGRILSRPALAPAARELAAVAVLAVMDQTPQLVAHGRGAMHFGATAEQVFEALYTALAPDDVAIHALHSKIVRSRRG
jgi:alkylhydroperoxidase/carboxymuconolactone decarboxylase family protein YurZ